MLGGRSLNSENNNVYQRAEFHDLIFSARCSAAEYYGRWSVHMTSKIFYRVLTCKERAFLFCPWEGWINPVASVCIKVGCSGRKNSTSYSVDIKPGVWC